MKIKKKGRIVASYVDSQFGIEDTVNISSRCQRERSQNISLISK